LRFAVHGPDFPVASPRSHGVPRRDVPGRVHVGVASESTGKTAEGGLALARPSVHMSAHRAALARERGTDSLHPAGRFLFQPTHKDTPPRSQDAPIQTGLGSDIAAGVLGSPSGRSRHVLDPKIFNSDYIEPTHDVRRDFLSPVLALVSLANAQPRDRVPDALTAVRAAAGAGEPPLQATQSLPLPLSGAGRVKHLASGKGRRNRDAPVNSDNLIITWGWNRIRHNRERNVPSTCTVQRHSVRLRCGEHGTGPAESHPADLRNPDFADFPAEAAQVPLFTAADDPEPFVPSCLTPRRSPGRVLPIEVRGCGLGEVTQSLLLHHLAACGQPRVFGPRLRELAALLQIIWAASTARTPVPVLFDSQIPHIPGMSAVLPEECLLSRRGVQTITGHTNKVSTTTDISGEVTAAPRRRRGGRCVRCDHDK
jgi:hypothetical protein